jgi:hypothetical protein
VSRTRIILLVSIALLAALFLSLAWRNSVALTSVSIRVKDGVKEHMDHTLLGLGAEHRLPDYKVQLRINHRMFPANLGTKLNTSATNWLHYAVNDLVPLRTVQEVVIVEEDKMENDVLERIQVTDREIEGADFRVRLATTRSFEIGMNWFFKTPMGKAVSIGIAVGIVAFIISLMRRAHL